MEINSNWTFKQLVLHLKQIRYEYNRCLCLFFERKHRINYIKSIRDTIYNLKLDYWQKERIWEFMNYDMSYTELKQVAGIRQNNK